MCPQDRPYQGDEMETEEPLETRLARYVVRENCELIAVYIDTGVPGIAGVDRVKLFSGVWAETLFLSMKVCPEVLDLQTPEELAHFKILLPFQMAYHIQARNQRLGGFNDYTKRNTQQARSGF